MTEREVTQRVQTAIDTARAALAAAGDAGVTIEDVRAQLDLDQTGDPAVFVTVVLAENTPESAWTSKHLDPISELLYTTLQDADLDRWIYVRFATPSALEPTRDTDGDSQGAA
jgi:hypothetical protein